MWWGSLFALGTTAEDRAIEPAPFSCEKGEMQLARRSKHSCHHQPWKSPRQEHVKSFYQLQNRNIHATDGIMGGGGKTEVRNWSQAAASVMWCTRAAHSANTNKTWSCSLFFKFKTCQVGVKHCFFWIFWLCLSTRNDWGPPCLAALLPCTSERI